MEQDTGVEPASSAWEADVLPMYESCVHDQFNTEHAKMQLFSVESLPQLALGGSFRYTDIRSVPLHETCAASRQSIKRKGCLNMILTASTPCAFSAEAPFTITTFGFADAPDAAAGLRRTFQKDLRGVVLSGSYDAVLRALPQTPCQAGILLLGNCGGGEDEFVRTLSRTLRCPLVGGSSAIDPVSGRAGLVTGGGQVSLFLMQDDRYQVRAETRNIHTELLGEHTISFSEPRVPDRIDGEPALAWLNARKAAYGIAPTDFEHMTFSDRNGINAHLSIADGRLVSGRDLEQTMLLRRVRDEDVLPQMRRFYDDPDAIVCGCAGLKSLLREPLMTGGFGLFLFGEVCTQNGNSTFGNLMLSKLVITER